jgi:L-fucose isomerase-like protein
MTRLNLVAFRSSLAGKDSVEGVHAALLSGLREAFELRLFEPDERGWEDGAQGPVLAFISSGGSERAFMEAYGRLPRPVLLLTDGLSNSLAASLEILSWVREMGGRAEILHGETGYLVARIQAALAGDSGRAESAALSRIASARIGVIGQPSEWLIASAVDYVAARRRWGTVFEDIELGELESLIDAVDEGEAEAAAGDFSSRACGILEPSPQDVVAASRVYIALRRLARERGLSALSLKCFDILKSRKTTGCMALALLNQEGMVAGCEGDQRTVFTMLAANALCGLPAFMANPASVDARGGRLVFAHCTVAPAMAQRYILRSHFESGIGVGIQGILPEGPATVLKIGGVGLDRYFVSSGAIDANPDDQRCCRTQIAVSLKEDAGYFLRSPLSNHHVIVLGDHAEKIASFLDAQGLARVR